MMRFGDYDCFCVETDLFFLDGGAMFGVVPKALWERKIPADEANRIPMQARSLVIRGRGKTILVDVGVGNNLPEKFRKIYGMEPASLSMADRLAKVGLSPQAITDVFLTHLHFDHVGGATHRWDGRMVPAFPHAVYHVQQAQWDLACNPSVRDQSSYLPDNFQPLESQGVLNRIDGSQDDFFDGIDLIVTHGHTRGQQHLLVKAAETSLFFCADLVPTSAHLPVAWNMAYDNEPLVLMAEKQAILSRAVAENWVLCFEHDPEVAAAFVREKNGRPVMGRPVDLGCYL